MSRRVGLGRCQGERARADVEVSGPVPMSSRADPCLFRVNRTHADFELTMPGPMSSRAGPGRCRFDRPGSMSS